MKVVAVLALLAVSLSANAQQEGGEDGRRASVYGSLAPHFGGYNDSGNFEGGLAVGVSVHGRRWVYGLGSLRLQLSNAFGLNLQSMYGINVLEMTQYGIFGLEPFNLDFNVVTSVDGASPRNYIQWNPAAALGFQIPAGICRFAVVMRGGASISTLLPGATGGLYGLAGYMNCDQVFDFAAQVTRLHSETQPVDMVQTEMMLPVIPTSDGAQIISVGLRAEMLTVHNGGAGFLLELPNQAAGDHAEFRGFLMLGLRSGI